MIVFKAVRAGRNRQGFTLIEVLVSMAVLSIVLVTLFRLQSSTVLLSEASSFKQTAPLLALRQINALVESKFRPEELPVEFKGHWKGYTWSCDIKDGGWNNGGDIGFSAARLKGLKRIQMTIFSPDRRRSFSLLTWRYDNEE